MKPKSKSSKAIRIWSLTIDVLLYAFRVVSLAGFPDDLTTFLSWLVKAAALMKQDLIGWILVCVALILLAINLDENTWAAILGLVRHRRIKKKQPIPITEFDAVASTMPKSSRNWHSADDLDELKRNATPASAKRSVRPSAEMLSDLQSALSKANDTSDSQARSAAQERSTRIADKARRVEGARSLLNKFINEGRSITTRNESVDWCRRVRIVLADLYRTEDNAKKFDEYVHLIWHERADYKLKLSDGLTFLESLASRISHEQIRIN